MIAGEKSVQPQNSTMQDFIGSFLEASRISLHSEANDLNRIPKKGARILVVNRLFGPVDPFLLLKGLSSVRQDVAVLTSFDYSNHTELEPSIVLLNIDDSEDTITGQFQNMINQEMLLIIFPAKQSTLSRITANMAMDKRWDQKLMRVLFQLDCPIQPIHISSESPPSLFHSKVFSFDGMIAFFQDMSLKEKRVHLRIGKPIEEMVKHSFTRPEDFARYVRAKLYALGSALDVNSFFSYLFINHRETVKSAIAPAIDPAIIEKELNALDKSHCLLQQAEYSIFLAAASSIPQTLKEIGRLREVTFREVGEGSGNALDLDEYDMYYHQLILWDHEQKKIAGGYRIGFGNEIMKLYGKRGFYLRSLFKFRKPFNEIFKQAIELGRSYITPDYQKARLPLFLLWKGILSVLLQHTAYRYLIGPVSISNEYSSFSRQLIVGFIKKYYWNSELAQHVKPRKAFVPPASDLDIDAIVEQLSPEMREVDKIIEEVEPQNYKLPVLIKKYIKQEAKIIGFNVDPSFSNVLDGLILLDINDVPLETLENLKKDLH